MVHETELAAEASIVARPSTLGRQSAGPSYVRASARRFGDIIRRIASRPGGFVGLLIVALILLCAVFAPQIATHNPDALDLAHRFAPPSLEHFFGTDQLGRDLFSRQIH